MRPFPFSCHTGFFLYGIEYGNESPNPYLSPIMFIPGGVNHRKVGTRHCNTHTDISTKLKKTNQSHRTENWVHNGHLK